MEKKFLVVTSINPPTEAVRRLASMPDYQIIMVGDKKTPLDWQEKNVTYLSPQVQESLPYSLLAHQPWNVPSRANIGYLYALENGASLITQVDDDNIPNEKWQIPLFQGSFATLKHDGFINIYRHFTDQFVWPRGLPLDKILLPHTAVTTESHHHVGVWQHLADNDTDVDAIYRLTNNTPVFFEQKRPVVLSVGTISPFNCQSTTFSQASAPLLYLPTCISPRASDIVRGLIAQPILWKHDLALGFTSPIVHQQRNPHNNLHDFKDEILIYNYSEEIFNTAMTSLSKSHSMADDLFSVYTALCTKNIIPEKELDSLTAWIDDIQLITR